MIEPAAQFPAGLEARPHLLRHRHFRAGARIVPGVGVSLFHREGAEPTQLNAAAASQSVGDLVEYRRHDQRHIRHPQMWIVGGNVRDEFCSGQCQPPRGGFCRQSGQRGSSVSAGAANR